jgi:hypothetical protein
MASYGFEALVIKNVFIGKRFALSEQFTAQIVATGLYLGTIRIPSINSILPVYADWERLLKALKTDFVLPGDSGDVVQNVLDQDRVVKKWWKTHCVKLVELSQRKFDKQAEGLAIAEGADSFVNQRRWLALATFKAATVQMYLLRNIPVDETTSAEFLKWLSQAWDEQITVNA